MDANGAFAQDGGIIIGQRVETLPDGRQVVTFPGVHIPPGGLDASYILAHATHTTLVGIVMKLTGGAANPVSVIAKIDEAKAALTGSPR